MVKVWVAKDRIKLQSHWFAGLPDVCKSIGGYRWDQAEKVWHYPATQEAAGQIMARFGTTELLATREFLELAGRAAAAEEARALKDATELPDLPRKDGQPEAWLHQRQAYAFAKEMDAWMLGIGMGGGKSKTAIGLLEHHAARRVAILAPNNVLKVWPKEFNGAVEADGTVRIGHAVREWRVLNGLYRNRKGRLVASPIKDRAAEFVHAIMHASEGTPVAICANYEAAPQGLLRDVLLGDPAAWRKAGGPAAYKFVKDLEERDEHLWDFVILDESHRIKAPGGQQSQFCGTLRTRARRRGCLTGTMMPHSPLDVYAQYRFLDPAVFGTSYARFRNRYAIMGGWQGKQVLGMNEAAAPELSEKIARLAYIITADELDKALGLHEPFWLPTGLCTLGDTAMQAYRGLLEEFVAQVGDGTITVNNALTQLLRLQQVTSGHLPVERICPHCEGDGCDRCDESGFYWDTIEVGTEKRDEAHEWIKDIDPHEPVAMVCRFRHDLDSIRWIAEQTGRRYGELSGRDASGLTEHATMRHDVDLLGVQIQSGGVGIDLTRARYAGNYSVGFSNGDFRQWLKRTHRPGQERQVFYKNFACEGTIDQAVFLKLEAREDVVRGILQMAKEGMLV